MVRIVKVYSSLAIVHVVNVRVQSFISAERAKRGRGSQHNVVRSKPAYPLASWDGGQAFELTIHLLGGNDALERAAVQ